MDGAVRDSGTQGDDQREQVADLGNHQLAGVVDIVGIADMENVTAAIGITHGGDVFGTPTGFAGGRAVAFAGTTFRLVHGLFGIGLRVLRILANASGLQNIAKVI